MAEPPADYLAPRIAAAEMAQVSRDMAHLISITYSTFFKCK
jgi:hypothetical protein